MNLAVIGLEDSLDTGLPDALNRQGIPTVGPVKKAAYLETSKLFTRDLMRKYEIPGQIEYHHFSDPNALRRFLLSSRRDFALKPVGLTAGKGVKVMGEHFTSVEEAIAYGETVIRDGIGGNSGLVVEERIVGEEFTLQTFVDGETVLPMPLVQDFKRAFDGDVGPNTGGMGSYSQPDGLLPFVTREERDFALEVLRKIIHALRMEGILYQGILYGQFMVTRGGLKLVELNARFGDPEAINVLPLLQNDLSEVCHAIVKGSLKHMALQFTPKATVCKYITPKGYGYNPIEGAPLTLELEQIDSLSIRVFYAKVKQGEGNQLLTTSSRSIALLGIDDTLEKAEARVEKALDYVHGEYQVRHDIAKKELLQRKSNFRKTLIGASL